MALRLGGMTAYELMERMSYEELKEWVEYDKHNFDDSWFQHASLMAKIDAACGVKRPDASKYLPAPPKKKSRTLEQLKNHMMSIASVVVKREQDGE